MGDGGSGGLAVTGGRQPRARLPLLSLFLHFWKRRGIGEGSAHGEDLCQESLYSASFHFGEQRRRRTREASSPRPDRGLRCPLHRPLLWGVRRWLLGVLPCGGLGGNSPASPPGGGGCWAAVP
ncbi:hypothetical protein MUK42_23188 [Musa troglodytarum]|uniref:Uncharacterized protein n=1 Tax=Musa troglodytarum TaxID=320322 RepID=A0A9E7HDB2_9LILI|nr:hypothetical protein MUK42_23188 [Musa troglodytarum]